MKNPLLTAAAEYFRSKWAQAGADWDKYDCLMTVFGRIITNNIVSLAEDEKNYVDAKNKIGKTLSTIIVGLMILIMINIMS